MRRPFFALLALALIGCSGKNPITGSGTVTYRISGSAIRADLTYSGSGESTIQQTDVLLPAERSIAAHSGDFLYISAQNTGSTGCVHVEIRSGNKTLQDAQSCGAFVIATASATF
jgi:hypothetical protein